jgi:hypothetical protein
MKALIHLVPRAGAGADWEKSVRGVADSLRGRAGDAGLRVNTMLRLAEDPIGRAKSFAGAIEVRGEDARPDAFESLLEGLGDRLEPFAHPDLCTSLLGEDVVFIATEPTPIRYQYLMRRNADFDHAGYLERYREIHSRFGLETPGIDGYTQFHVDASTSRRLAAISGLGIWGVDSVSELHLRSVEHFIGEITKSDIGARAAADEEIFVDRARSADFCSTVEWSA